MQKVLTLKQQLLLRSTATNAASRRIAQRIIDQCTPQAIAAATNGDAEAQEWLEVCLPDVAEQVQTKHEFRIFTQAGRHRNRTSVL